MSGAHANPTAIFSRTASARMGASPAMSRNILAATCASEADNLAGIMQSDGLAILAEHPSLEKRNALLTQVITMPGVT